MRIAFITSEFVTEYADGGGLGNYLNRITQILVEHGHDVEVFVSSPREPRVIAHGGVRVERVPLPRALWLRAIGFGVNLVGVAPHLRQVFLWMAQARALAEAMERRHREAPFALVQSADYLAVGLSVRRMPGRTHVVRCSTAADLYNQSDNALSKAQQWRETLERKSMIRADRVYAPSRFVAEHYSRQFGIPVDVLRPPLGKEASAAPQAPCGLPDRFLIHFGQFKRRKGTPWLVEALTRAFEIEPTIRMVLIGRGDFHEMTALLKGLGTHRGKVQVWYPLAKPELYAVLQRATAAVLPSLVDNLPNTVIETLTFGVPVIGTRGASIDELVEHGVTGELVEPGDVNALADAIVRVWRGETSVHKGFKWQGGVAEQMEPRAAVEHLLQLATPRG